MLTQQRYEKILALIKANSFVKVSELTEVFGVSIETVRRDLFFLESCGLLKRVHGGAARSDALELQDLSHRMTRQKENKKRLSETAMTLIKEKDIIAVDCGSTAIEFAETLKEKFNSLTVVTNSAGVFRVLQDLPAYNLILTGGQFYRGEDAFYGSLTQIQLKELSVYKAFIFPSFVSVKHGVTHYLPEFIPVERAFLEIADQGIIMADSTKFESTAIYKLCDVSTDHIYITDDDLSDEIYEKFLSLSINIFRGDKNQRVSDYQQR